MEFTYEGLVRWGFGFHNPNHAAAAICAVLPFLWGWRRRAWIGWGLSVPLLAALALTYSRTGFAVAALEAVAFAAWSRRWRFAVAAVVLLVLVAAIGGVAGRFAPDAAALNRLSIWWAGLKLAAANPWGVGFGNSGLLASAFMLDGIECRTLVNSHLTLLAEFGWIVGCAWVAFMAFALVRGTRHLRTWCAFVGLCVSAFTSSAFDWHVLFDWSDMGGLGAVNFALAWTLFAAFLAMGLRLAIGGRCDGDGGVRGAPALPDGDAACTGRQPYRMAMVAVVPVFMFAALWVTPSADVPKVRHGFVVKEGRDMPLVLHGEEWTLKAVVDRLSGQDGGIPDGYRLAIVSGFVPPDMPPASVWLFGTVAESAHRFRDVQTTAVSPSEFCVLPTDVRVVK